MPLVSLVAVALTACGVSSAAPPESPPASPPVSAALAPAAPAAPAVVDHRDAWRAELTARRAAAFARLAAYKDARRFALNLEGGAPKKVFRDFAGNLCAMADVMFASGAHDLVEKTAVGHNDIVLATVRSGEVHEWMLRSGLLQEEIAFIQGIAPLTFEHIQPIAVDLVAQRIVPELPQQVTLVNMNGEVERIAVHLDHVLRTLAANDPEAIAIALDRLGARLAEAP